MVSNSITLGNMPVLHIYKWQNIVTSPPISSFPSLILLLSHCLLVDSGTFWAFRTQGPCTCWLPSARTAFLPGICIECGLTSLSPCPLSPPKETSSHVPWQLLARHTSPTPSFALITMQLSHSRVCHVSVSFTTMEALQICSFVFCFNSVFSIPE